MCFLTFPAGFLILTLGDVPCFHKMKVMHNSVLKVNGLLLIRKIFVGGRDYAHHITAYMKVTYVCIGKS